MRRRGIPEQLIIWLTHKLCGRKTTLIYDDYESPAFDIENGLDQGCPMSGILNEHGAREHSSMQRARQHRKS